LELESLSDISIEKGSSCVSGFTELQDETINKIENKQMTDNLYTTSTPY